MKMFFSIEQISNGIVATDYYGHKTYHESVEGFAADCVSKNIKVGLKEEDKTGNIVSFEFSVFKPQQG